MKETLILEEEDDKMRSALLGQEDVELRGKRQDGEGGEELKVLCRGTVNGGDCLGWND